MGDQIIERALVVDTKEGLVVVTGCSHPGIVHIVKQAREHLNRPVFMVLGGTHLREHSDEQLQQVIADLKRLGLQKMGATHCSGDRTIVKLREEWDDGFIKLGVGRVLDTGKD